jgi:peptide/nickel transport system substrate-binding protein
MQGGSSRRFAAALIVGLLPLIGPAVAQSPKNGGTVHVVVQPEPPMLMQGLNQNGPTNMVAGKHLRVAPAL